MFSNRFAKRTQAEEVLAEEVALVRKSPLLDPVWYREAYTDLRDTPIDVARHYLQHGAAEGRNPGPQFDTVFYQQTYPDVAATGVNPLVHYLRHGHAEGRLPMQPSATKDALTGEIELLQKSPLLDPIWYREAYTDLRGTPIDVARHYLQHGAAEGRNPGPQFDTVFYQQTYPDVAATGVNPLVHYLRHGRAEGRLPMHPSAATDALTAEIELLQKSPLLDPTWYRETYTDLRDTPIDVARHYLQRGAAEGRNPGPQFETAFYQQTYPDIAATGVNPLVHYLRHGRAEGRLPMRPPEVVKAVSETNIRIIKEPSFARELALFVTHSPDGFLKPHVIHYLHLLAVSNITPILIVMSDKPFSTIDQEILAKLGGLLVRDNHGFDFAAWAHVLQLFPIIYDADIVYLLNDSVIGPLSSTLLSNVLNSVRATDKDMVALTENYEIRWHVQSYFLVFKRNALKSTALRSFFENVVSYSTKQSVIIQYEIQLGSCLQSAGLRWDVLFPSTTSAPVNRTIYDWKRLVEAGFPFIKVTTIRDRFPGVDIEDWRRFAQSHGYDDRLADPLLSRTQSSENSRDEDLTPKEGLSGSLPPDSSLDDFSADLYLAMYPDVAAAGVDPRHHYEQHGRREGRIGAVNGLAALARKRNIDPAKPTVLIVTHEGGRGGCPVLSYNIVRQLSTKYNIVALFLGSGPVLDACKDLKASVIGPITLAGAPKVSDIIIGYIAKNVPLSFAIANSIESRYVLEPLARRFVPSLCLIHEFAAYIRPVHAFREAVLWASEAIFSTELTLESVRSACPDIGMKRLRVLPQGRSIIPPEPGSLPIQTATTVASARSLKFNKESIVVLGVGKVEYRKGVDLFLQCAMLAKTIAPELNIQFVWIGGGYSLTKDLSYSIYLDDQIKRGGIQDRVHFIDETPNLNEFFQRADIFLLSSRLDPLPNVAIDALHMNIPVLCFDGTTGIAPALKAAGLAADCVAKYMDVHDLASKVVDLARSSKRREHVGHVGKEHSIAAFDMAQYVSKLEEIALSKRDSMVQERSDADAIDAAGVIRSDFYIPQSVNAGTENAVACEYVRSWASGISQRKLFPGFHPGIYRDIQKSRIVGDPTAHYLRSGRPQGPWQFRVINPQNQQTGISAQVRAALHIHGYYTDLVDDIIHRVGRNKHPVDIFISVTNSGAWEFAETELKKRHNALRGSVVVKIVPNKGRDIGPFLTEFGPTLIENYDVIGHVHTKKTADIANEEVGKRWYEFLLENLIGGTAPMMDIILSAMAEDSNIGLVFPDDPHVVGWDSNREYVEPILRRLSIDQVPENFAFPIGTMFWARTEAIKGFVTLGLDWDDYPAEPLPYDGSLLHGIERLFGVVAANGGFKIATTNVPGVGR